MPTDTVDDWEVISTRLAALPDAISGYIASLREGARSGVVPARRQVTEVAGQIARYTADTGFFAEFVGSASPAEGQLPASLARALADRSGAARVAYDGLAHFLQTELAADAGEQDAVGRDLYALHSRRFLGASIDLDETYEWGIEELARMVAEQEEVAKEILPGASVEEAVAFLEADPSRKLHGTDALQRWMQETSDRAVAELGATHFDIPEPIRRLECMIAPTREGGIYYTGPTDDFSRPGRMWWSVPEGVESFDTWRELTTVYHEGVPGHHLQIAQAVYNRAELNSWRRLLAGTSGHAEGWALYAERLMQELGYLDDPADRLGMLDGQRMRAARVVLDIGVHLGKTRPDGKGVWDADYALDVHATQRQHARRVRAVRGEPLSRLARSGALLQGGPAHLGAGARAVSRRPRRRLRHQGVPQAGAGRRRGRARHAGDRPATRLDRYGHGHADAAAGMIPPRHPFYACEWKGGS